MTPLGAELILLLTPLLEKAKTAPMFILGAMPWSIPMASEGTNGGIKSYSLFQRPKNYPFLRKKKTKGAFIFLMGRARLHDFNDISNYLTQVLIPH